MMGMRSGARSIGGVVGKLRQDVTPADGPVVPAWSS